MKKIATTPEIIAAEWTKFDDWRTSMGFTAQWPENIRFIEGKQWPKPTESTKYMPRPVINLCDFTIENKKSNILSQSMKIVFKPDEVTEQEDEQELQAASDYTDLATQTWEDIEQDELNEEAVFNALAVSAGIFYYYYDNSYMSKGKTPYVGRLCGESIDPMDFAVGNPRLPATKLQQQPYIILRSQVDLEQAKKMAEASGEDPAKVTPDAENNATEYYDNEKKKLTDSTAVTMYTKFYKKNGDVFWIQTTDTVVLRKESRLSPSAKKFELYPVEMLVFKKKHKCIFGRSVIEDMLKTQQAINWQLGMMLLSVQQTAWPKILAKFGALEGQKVTNEPGEILTDMSVAGDGIKFMQPPNFSQFPMQLTDKMIELVRIVSGVTEVSTGEALGANMAAAAIISLQNQAKKPNESYMKMLYNSLKNIARIWEMFYKTYYNMERPVVSKTPTGEEMTRKVVGTDYADKKFNLKIDIGPASEFSEVLQVSTLDNMANRQWIDKYDYVEFAPSNIIPAGLKQKFEEEQKQMEAQQQAMQEQAQNAQQGIDVNALIASLSPEEQAHLAQNPDLIDQALSGGMGGV